MKVFPYNQRNGDKEILCAQETHRALHGIILTLHGIILKNMKMFTVHLIKLR